MKEHTRLFDEHFFFLQQQHKPTVRRARRAAFDEVQRKTLVCDRAVDCDRRLRP